MITCVLCKEMMTRSPFCSDYAVLVLHWMSKHPQVWVQMHPETTPYLHLEPV